MATLPGLYAAGTASAARLAQSAWSGGSLGKSVDESACQALLSPLSPRAPRALALLEGRFTHALPLAALPMACHDCRWGVELTIRVANSGCRQTACGRILRLRRRELAGRHRRILLSDSTCRALSTCGRCRGSILVASVTCVWKPSMAKEGRSLR
ncbi:hypothetical protein DSL92_03175 [Billgrantia gudaonensis]|uniref:Uncharacterized protein n=1 Tax=Billgrantia gudaonensis TaxID=376427 RepID=A0A432JJT8_9GAMM|nr:hypothetical protein DSL92_03175 [Halomonas gudaonensis]